MSKYEFQYNKTALVRSRHHFLSRISRVPKHFDDSYRHPIVMSRTCTEVNNAFCPPPQPPSPNDQCRPCLGGDGVCRSTTQQKVRPLHRAIHLLLDFVRVSGHVCKYVCMVTHIQQQQHSKSMDQPGKVASPASKWSAEQEK